MCRDDKQELSTENCKTNTDENLSCYGMWYSIHLELKVIFICSPDTLATLTQKVSNWQMRMDFVADNEGCLMVVRI